jgi:hypothetical protein
MGGTLCPSSSTTERQMMRLSAPLSFALFTVWYVVRTTFVHYHELETLLL